jgi:DNA-binding Xre family transcriptional regulator
MTIRLRVRDIAASQGYTLSQFQLAIQLSMSTTRRLWYSTSDGLEKGAPLKLISLDLIEHVARFFSVPVGDLFEIVPATSEAGNASRPGAHLPRHGTECGSWD